MNKNNFTWLLLHFAALLPGRLRVVSYFLAVFWLRLLENIEDSCEIWLEKCYFFTYQASFTQQFLLALLRCLFVFCLLLFVSPPKKKLPKNEEDE